jgi:hypothetical protein
MGLDSPTRGDASVQRLQIEIPGACSVSALLCVPDGAWASALTRARSSESGSVHSARKASAHGVVGQVGQAMRCDWAYSSITWPTSTSTRMDARPSVAGSARA